MNNSELFKWKHFLNHIQISDVTNIQQPPRVFFNNKKREREKLKLFT